MNTLYFQLGLIVGLQLSCLVVVILFLFYGHKAKRHIRKYLNEWERKEREKREL